MRVFLSAAFALCVLFVATILGQAPATDAAAPKLPDPGTRGNADNVPYIGKSDPRGNPVRLAKSTGHVSNYSEEKVAAYTLPDPLVLANGEKVTTAQMWREKRRPEILKFYETEIYGRVPDNAPKVAWEVTETDATAREGAAIMKRVVGRMGDKPDGPRMNLTVHLPAKASGPAPMLLSISFGFPPGGRGGKIATEQKGGAPAAGANADGQKAKVRPPAFDALGELLSRGWGYAVLNYGDIQPDRADKWTSGVIGLTLMEGQTNPNPDQWGTISAWSWGISRAIDYLETEKTVNPKQNSAVGFGQGRANRGRVFGRLWRDGGRAHSPRLGRNARRHGSKLRLAVLRQHAEMGRPLE
jgi:hypothetical protein